MVSRISKRDESVLLEICVKREKCANVRMLEYEMHVVYAYVDTLVF